MTTRKYSSRSQQTTLTSGITSTATSATVVSGSSLLGGASIASGETFTIVIDPDTALEEIVDVTAVSTNTLTIVRGIETSGIGQAHSAGAVVRHMVTGRDLREANQHIENTTTAHGITLANLVKTTDTGTVTSTMIADGTIVNADISTTAAIAATKISGTAVTQADTGTVTSTMIANGTIVDADINSSAAIAKTKISGTALTAADTGTVNATILADLAVTNAKLTTDSVTTAKITDLNVTTAKIADSAITSAKIADGTIVNNDISSTAAIALSKLATDPLARANHTGTQAASSISDFDTQVRTSRLDQMAAPTGSVAMNAQKITGVADPTLAQDASTKAYVDSQITSLVGGAPGTLDTLNEIAAAINNSGSFATSVVLRDGTQAMTGALAMGTNKITGLGTPTASTDAATKAYADSIIASAPSNLTGPITSIGAATSIASQTGTGSTFVMNTSPTIVTALASAGTAASTPLIVKGVTSQTGDLLQIQNSAANILSYFSANGNLVVGSGAGSASAVMELGSGRSADGNAYIDFVSDTTYTDFGLRIIRSGGANGTGSLQFRGTGGFSLNTIDASPLTFATTNTTRMAIDASGKIAMGTSAANSAISVIISGSSTGQSSYNGVYVNTAIAADTTSQYKGFASVPSTTAAAFTLATLRHFFVSGVTVGAGSTVSTQVGYYVESNMTGATSNLGFQSSLAVSGTANYNFYAGGTAPNYFAGRVGIGGTNSAGGSMAYIVNTTAADVGIMVRGAASQTGDLQQWQNSAGTVLSSVSASGIFYPAGIQVQRQDSSSEGGQLSLARASDNALAWYVDVYGSTSTPSFRIVDNTASSARLTIDGSGYTTIGLIADGTTSTAATGGGFMGMPQNSTTTGSYTIVAGDAGKHIYSTATRTVTIPANGSVAFPVGTVLSFISGAGATTTIAITTDTMYLAGSGTTGSRTLAAHGMATAVKVTSTTWYISGNGLT